MGPVATGPGPAGLTGAGGEGDAGAGTLTLEVVVRSGSSAGLLAELGVLTGDAGGVGSGSASAAGSG